MTTECRREQEVLEAVTSGRAPGEIDAELAEHVALCGVCADLAEVAAAFAADRDALAPDARVPSAARIWWRAQLRARQEAARAAAQPITFAQGLAVACGVGIAFAVLGFASPWVRDRLAWLIASARSVNVASDLAALVAALQGSTLWVVALAASLLIVAPVAIYLTVEDD